MGGSNAPLTFRGDKLEDFYKEQMTRTFGRRRGSLYRSEKDYYALGDSRFGPGPAYDMKATAKVVERNRQGAYSADGSTKGGHLGPYIGSIPLNIVLCHPELSQDEQAILEFFKEHNKFSMKG